MRRHGNEERRNLSATRKVIRAGAIGAAADAAGVDGAKLTAREYRRGLEEQLTSFAADE